MLGIRIHKEQGWLTTAGEQSGRQAFNEMRIAIRILFALSLFRFVLFRVFLVHSMLTDLDGWNEHSTKQNETNEKSG